MSASARTDSSAWWSWLAEPRCAGNCPCFVDAVEGADVSPVNGETLLVCKNMPLLSCCLLALALYWASLDEVVSFKSMTPAMPSGFELARDATWWCSEMDDKELLS